MSLAIVYSRASMGVQAPLVTIEVHLSNGKPGFTLVGLPEKTVKEAQDRVRSALMNAQFKYPAKRITVNLAPADLPKEGGRFDLPIAIGILAASGQIDSDLLKQFEFLGELALTGGLRGVHGAIPAVISAEKAKRCMILARPNANEASLVSNAKTYFASSLLQVVNFLNRRDSLPIAQEISQNAEEKSPLVSRDLSIIIPHKMPYERVCNVINELKIPDLKAHFITDIYSDESLGDKQSVTIKFNFQNISKLVQSIPCSY